MKVMVEIRHPAHVHHFRIFIQELRERGHQVKVVAVKKDMSTDLLTYYGIEYALIGEKRQGFVRGALEQSLQILNVVRLCREFRPDVLIGRPSMSVNLAGAIMRTPRIIFAVDDLPAVPLAGFTAYPFATVVLTPYVTDVGRFEHKRIGYAGYHELAYLHPLRFVPDRTLIEALVGRTEPYFLVRLASLTAHHDVRKRGITDALMDRLIGTLSARGRIFISSERPIPSRFEKYRIQINPTLIHHVLFYCDLFIGDSQSMTKEAAVLGTPSIRFSDFAGRLSVLEELEHTYDLTRGVTPDDPEALFSALDAVLNMPDRRVEWQRRRHRMLGDKIDLTGYMLWFVERYPESATMVRSDPLYPQRFAVDAHDRAYNGT